MNTVVAKEYLCFDALLEVIVSDAYPSFRFSQLDFAEEFGITLPIGTQTDIINVKYSNDIEKCGTNINTNVVNKFFQHNSIPLHISFISPNYIDEITFGNFIISQKEKAYIVFAFCYGILFNEPQNLDVGHVVMLESFDSKSDTLKIFDPGPRNFGSKIIKADDMIYAMKRRGGIFLFERVNLK